ncbi:YdcF family protein [Caballeronia sp. LZ032]|uniref:YdcF family protein n=1 Tax=Caballeronia sp. LZ032 TaxID=3038565 RepID=UPI00285A0309|nr:YdcF family protein [Caballeronia sp. LZ032]MDR5878298.1 YdcF family protein [Caballeronia sp. LZ032]
MQIVIVTAALAWGIGAGWFAAPLLAVAQRGYTRTAAPDFAPDTIIVLMGGGTDRSDTGLVPKPDSMQRIAATAALYRECREAARSCKVIVSGGDPEHHGQAEADNYAPYVLAQGVQPDDLVRENQSLNTWQNARNVAAIVGRAHDNRLIIVTSAYHMRRSLRAFQAFGFDPQPYVSSARHGHVTLLPRLGSFETSEIALHELVGLARFGVYRWLHLY